MTEENQKIVDSLGIPYDTDGAVPMFHVKNVDELKRIKEALKSNCSYGYYLSKELRDDERRFDPSPVEEEKPEPAKEEHGIFMYDKKDHDKLIQVFDSLKSAATFANPDKVASAQASISNCVNGKAASACGYYWERR